MFSRRKCCWLAPIAWPIARLLDAVLGTHDHHTYKKAELKSFLQFHRTGDEPLRDEEIAILNAVLELNTKKAESIMTPLKVGSNPMYLCRLFDWILAGYTSSCRRCYTGLCRCSLYVSFASHNDTWSFPYTLCTLSMNNGYSRIPVHETGDPASFIGILLVKTVCNYFSRLYWYWSTVHLSSWCMTPRWLFLFLHSHYHFYQKLLLQSTVFRPLTICEIFLIRWPKLCRYWNQ